MKIKAKYKNDKVTVKMILKHPMEPGEISGRKEESHYITSVVASVNGKVVYDVVTTPFISKNPYFKFSFTGAKKGDKIEVKWVDNKGKSKTKKAKIK